MKMVSRLFLAFALVSVLCSASFAEEEKKFGNNVGDFLKSVTLVDPTDGKSYNIPDPKSGKDTLVFFMQTACSLCVEELYAILDVKDTVKEKADVRFVSVDLDPKRIEPYKKNYNNPFPIVHDKDAIFLLAVGFGSTPASLVVDKDGKIKSKLAGYNAFEIKKLMKSYK